MRFYLVDRIESIEPGKRIVTTKSLSLAEEYLADHFPGFPVMPGVMMVEAMVQSAAWLVRVAQDWSRSVVVLGAARNIRYTNFVQPGMTLRCELQATSIGPDSAKFKAAGHLGSEQAVGGRLELRCFNLADRANHPAGADKALVARLKEQFKLIGGPEALAAAAGA